MTVVMSVAMHDDVIIIGGGHNGLIVGANLAKAGLRVRLFEARDIFGGACVTEDIAGAPGYRVSTGAAQIGNLKPQIIKDLNLAHFGFQLLTPEPLGVFPFPDGRYLALWSDPAQTKAEFAKFSAHDADHLDAYFTDLAAVCDLVEAAIESPLLPNLESLEQNFNAAHKGHLFEPFITGSISSLMDRYFESEEAKTVLGYTATFGTNAGPKTAGTAYVMVHHMLGNVTGRRGRTVYVKGGMGGLADALVAAARSYGVQMMPTRRIAHIITSSGVATGVETEDGKRYYARAVISNADPKTTYLKLVGRAHLDAGFVDKIESVETNGVALKVNCALDRLPKFTALPNNMVPARVSICPSLDYVDEAWQAAQNRQLPANPYMTVHMQSAIDPSLAPYGKHTLTCYAQFFSYELDRRLGSWEQQASVARDTVLATVAGFAPDIHQVISSCEVVTPVDLERIFGMVGGHQFHGDLMPGNIFDQRVSSATSPIERLYLCGAGAHPGGCVWGAPAEVATRSVLADLNH